jgi:hypothetical protein
MCQTFQLVGADHDNIYVAACHANSVDFYIVTPRKAFQPELSHLLLEKAAFIAMISIFFGMLMGAVQFAGLFAVRQIVANMVDACAHALDGVIKGRAEAAAGRNIRGSFLAWFTDTRPIVEAQAAVHALVQDLMTALPSREAPSALRLVQGLPQGSAEANPFAAATGGPAAQTGVASTLMFHLGSVSLLHRDDKTAYCEIMNAATLIVDTAGGALERVAAGYLLATFNCHLPCAEHAQVAVEAALKIHAMMQAHHCSQSPADSGSESFFHALGHKYSLIVDSGPFTLHSFEEIGETRNTTMRCSVLESASEALLLDLAPLMSMLRVRVSATEVAAAAIHLPTCVVDCVEVTDRAGTMRELQLFEVITDSSSMEPDQQQRIAGLFARMRAGDYDGALRLSCGETRQLHRHEDRLRLICKDKINSFITRRTPLLPYARSEWGIWLPLTADELERKKR